MNHHIHASWITVPLFVIVVLCTWAMVIYAAFAGGTLEFTAQNSGYYEVMVGDQKVSQHTTEREAWQSAANQAMAGRADVRVVHDFVATVTYTPDTGSPVAATQLSWTAPTTRADGSALAPEEIGGYRIYHGASADSLTMDIDIKDGATLSYTYTPAVFGYFAATVYDTDGNESVFSNIIHKVKPQ